MQDFPADTSHDNSTSTMETVPLKDINSREIRSVRHCVYSKRFWQFFTMMLFSNYFGTFFMYTYKTYGENKSPHPPISDALLTWAASIGAGAVNGTSRVILGSLYDKFGFKKLFSVLMIS